MKIIGIGKNYVKEMADMPKEQVTPVIFLKADSTLLENNADFLFPAFSQEVGYELELALRIGKTAKNVSEADAMSYVDGIGLANDLTASDMLAKSRETKGPWALAKGFDGATPISAFQPISTIKDIHNVNFTLEMNGEIVQVGNSSLMITTPERMIAYVSSVMTLNPGDILLTGTPAIGAGKLKDGDKMIGYLEGVKLLETFVK